MGDAGEAAHGSALIPPCSSRVMFPCLAPGLCFHWLPIVMGQKHSGSGGQKRTEVGRQKSLGHPLFWILNVLRSTEIRETRALLSRAIFWWPSGGLGVLLQEKRGWRKIWGAGVPFCC